MTADEDNRQLRSFIAHLREHLANGRLTLQEFDIDFRALGGGEWIDTEYLLKCALVENDRLRSLLGKQNPVSLS